ncbi:MAG: hypothetical protein ACI4OR_03965 [Alphaproteobacteria bacterium]
MRSLPPKKGPQIDVFIPASDGHFVSLNAVENQLKERKKNYEQQIEVNNKLIKNFKLDSMRSTAALVMSMACLGALLSPNRLVQKVGLIGAATTTMLNTAGIIALSNDKKKLEQKKAFLKQQEWSLV